MLRLFYVHIFNLFVHLIIKYYCSMNSFARQDSFKNTKSISANAKESHFRINTHVKTLNLHVPNDHKNNNLPPQEPNNSSKHYEQLGLKLRSTQLESTNHEQRTDEFDVSTKSPKFINKTARISTFSASKAFPESPIETARRANDVFKIKTEKNLSKHQSVNPQNDVELRLSLANFHQKLKTMNYQGKVKTGGSDDKLINLKLQGVQYSMKEEQGCKRYNIRSGQCRDGEVLIRKTMNYKKGFKVSKQELSNLDEFNKLLSKIHMESNEQEIIEMKRPNVKSRRMQVQSASHFRKRQQAKQTPPTRDNVKVNIINIAESKPFQEKPRCHQIYMKYFLKSEDCTLQKEVQNNKKTFTAGELSKELKEIKKEIVQKQTVKQRKPLTQQQKFTKYTTSFIEEKLIKRKSLIKNYTFKKKSHDPKRINPGDDFFVEGWEAEPVAS